MWIFYTRGFASVVENTEDPTGKTLLARSRFNGDLEKLFPGHKVERTPNRDYLYRAVVNRKAAADLVAKMVMDIDYPNFKDAVPEKRATLYSRVWSILYCAQRNVMSRRRKKARAGYSESDLYRDYFFR